MLTEIFIYMQNVFQLRIQFNDILCNWSTQSAFLDSQQLSNKLE